MRLLGALYGFLILAAGLSVYSPPVWRLTVTEPTARQALEFEDIRRAGLRDLSSLGSLGFREFRVLGV